MFKALKEAQRLSGGCYAFHFEINGKRYNTYSWAFVELQHLVHYKDIKFVDV